MKIIKPGKASHDDSDMEREMLGLAHTAKIREYCDYIDEHLRNVQKAWETVQEKCGDLHPLIDDFLWAFIDESIRMHDLSKFGPQEFIQYQRKFHPVPNFQGGFEAEFEAAMECHKALNPHHWENWTQRDEEFPNQNACYCVEMVCDWMAMGVHYGDTAEAYYLKNVDRIRLPQWGRELVAEIFERIRE